MKKIHAIAFTSGLTGLLFGYDTGVIASALIFIRTAFHLNDWQTGITVSIVPFGALLASFFSGKLCNAIGRKRALLLTAILFISGSLLSALTLSFAGLLAGRLMIGIATGAGSCISPVYTAELAHEKQRGWLVNIFVVMIQAGICISFLAGYLLSLDSAWRMLFALGVLPALLLFLLALYLPESPRWLLLRGQRQRARDIFVSLSGEKHADTSLAALDTMLAHEKNQTRATVWRAPFLRILLIGIIVSFFTQTVGINMLNYYAPTIFMQTGFSTPAAAIRMTLLMGGVLTLSTLFSLKFIDRIGRRPLLLFAMRGILVSLFMMVMTFYFLKSPVLQGWLFFIATVLFMLFHGAGIGPACFLIPAEIFPLRVRSPGMGISVACNWGANVLVAALVPPGLATLGTAGLFLVFFLISAGGYILFYLFVPETRGATLETIENNMLTVTPRMSRGLV